MPTTSTDRMREKRERDKLAKEEKEARLLLYRLRLDIYKGTAVHFDRIRELTGIEEPQDALTRLIHYLGQASDEHIKEALKAP